MIQDSESDVNHFGRQCGPFSITKSVPGCSCLIKIHAGLGDNQNEVEANPYMDHEWLTFQNRRHCRPLYRHQTEVLKKVQD
jgi:hypothetical protein